MRVTVAAADRALDARTARLLRRMLCPLTGLSQEIGFVMRGAREPRVAISGGEMTGVHVLRGTRPPPRGAFHIGAAGTTLEEAVVRTLGETAERYAEFSAALDGGDEVITAPLEALAAEGRRVLAPPGLRLFSDAQHERPGFPFERVDASTPIGWVPARQLPDREPCLLPARAALPGYGGRAGEPRYVEGVTTGSAAHTALAPALRNALLELVQIDAAMGHWYAGGGSVALRLDARTGAAARAIERRLARHAEWPRFFWLRSADLPGFAVAAVLTAPDAPRVAVGLGSDLRLGRAVYKAFLEGCAVMQLAKVTLFRQALAARDGVARPDPEAAIYDLDSNVARYAAGDAATVLDRYERGEDAAAADLPPDVDDGPSGDVRHLVRGFAEAGLRLAVLDRTPADVRALGFRAVRVWSPDALTLSLPSAPPAAHPRFAAYGGFLRDLPHPLP